MEARQCRSAWIEIIFSISTVACGLYVGWPIHRPYVLETPWLHSLTYKTSPELVGVFFFLAGLYQTLAYFYLRNRRPRIMAAQVQAALWGATAFVLLIDRAVGVAPIMTATGFAAQIVAFKLLLDQERPSRLRGREEGGLIHTE